MAGLQRSTSSFRRQGSSGLVWDDKLLAAEVKKAEQEKQQRRQEEEEQKKEAKPSTTVGSISTLDRSRSNGGERAFRTDKVSPAIEPPSPKVSACGFCSAFGKPDKTRRRPKSGRRRT
ncbi:uncharacterized protein At1g15400-like [Cornus florida]|uniref:uncharacterized protein At1g15400-like n=1 Tax=Cornus florida TaxID=4283 RepID=UPI0028A294ED|nr:uncharacterized protein At1g15400-like [Cornus florida]